MARIALDHHRRRLEDGVRDLRDAELLVVRLLRRDDRRVRREHEVDAGIRHLFLEVDGWHKPGRRVANVTTRVTSYVFE